VFNGIIFQDYLTTQVLGRQVHYYPQLPSTNTQAWQSDPETLAHGAVILTDHQTAGRGRWDNTWIATAGKSLTCSIVLKPNVPANQLPLYSILAGASLAHVLSKMDLIPQLKWPNDVLLKKKKVAGILCESKISSDRVSMLVVGLGLNVNEAREDFPPDLRETITSLYLHTGHAHEREKILALILKIFENNLREVGVSPTPNFLKTWWRFCAHRHRQVTFQEKGQIVKGIFRGLTDRGEAILERDGAREIHLPDFVEINTKLR
jgi:BirA family biotin operon repressor/biotin-[acetyl-CoA-carboxylase] ligase